MITIMARAYRLTVSLTPTLAHSRTRRIAITITSKIMSDRSDVAVCDARKALGRVGKKDRVPLVGGDGEQRWRVFGGEHGGDGIAEKLEG